MNRKILPSAIVRQMKCRWKRVRMFHLPLKQLSVFDEQRGYIHPKEDRLGGRGKSEEQDILGSIIYCRVVISKI